MTTEPVDHASLMCSRLCHDLLSPVGAINNGLELLADEDDPAMRERCMELIAESAKSAADKLKFFRLAFGAAGGFGEQVDVRDLKGAVAGLGGSKVTLEWLVEQPTLSKRAAKVLLNLALVAADALVRGGTLTIGAEEGPALGEVVVRAEGPRIAADAEVLTALRGELAEADVSSRTAAAWMIARLAGAEGGGVQVAQEDGALLLGASLR